MLNVRWGALALTIALAFAIYGGYKWLEDPRSQLFGKTLVRGPAQERIVALTYDDGPNPPYTSEILDVLDAEHVHATFFVVGRAVAAYPAVVRRMVREGHALGNHTWDHAHLIVLTPFQVHQELQRTDEAIYRATGVRTRLMRPPFGARDFASLDQVHRDGYIPVMWSVPLPADWAQPGDRTITRRVVEDVTPGSIIVLHDGNRGILCGRDRRVPLRVCDRSQDVAATHEIIEALKTRGYRFVTIPELLRVVALTRIRGRAAQ